MTTSTTAPSDRPRIIPSRFRRSIGDPLAKRLATLLRSQRMGVLHTRRSDGSPRSTALGVWTHAGGRYLVALFGDTFWVRDLRAGRPAELEAGGTRRPIAVTELTGQEGADAWSWFVREYRTPARRYARVSSDPGPDELARLALERPVFRID